MDLLDSNVSSIIVKRNVFGCKFKPTHNLTDLGTLIQRRGAMVEACGNAGMTNAADRLSIITDNLIYPAVLYGQKADLGIVYPRVPIVHEWCYPRSLRSESRKFFVRDFFSYLIRTDFEMLMLFRGKCCLDGCTKSLIDETAVIVGEMRQLMLNLSGSNAKVENVRPFRGFNVVRWFANDLVMKAEARELVRLARQLQSSSSEIFAS
jgi:hypothetical protein